MDVHEAIEAAENAAMTLWSTLEDLRQDLAKVHTPYTVKAGQKRTTPKRSASSDDLWTHMQSLESTFILHRRSVLDKWSSKVRAARPSDVRGKLIPKAEPQGISAVLDTQLTAESDKLVKRTQIPRSGAPVQAQLVSKNDTNTAENSSIFDDTDFYQLQLRELVEQRMDSSGTQGGALPIATSLRATRV